MSQIGVGVFKTVNNTDPSVPIFIDSITVDLKGYVPSEPICVTEEAE